MVLNPSRLNAPEGLPKKPASIALAGNSLVVDSFSVPRTTATIRTLHASQILGSVLIVIGRPASICCQWRGGRIRRQSYPLGCGRVS